MVDKYFVSPSVNSVTFLYVLLITCMAAIPADNIIISASYIAPLTLISIE